MKGFLKKFPTIAIVLNDRDVISLTKEEIKDADIIELRIDLFENIEKIEDIFHEAKERFDLPLIATIRIPQEGGGKNFENRVDHYRKILDYVQFIDVEIFSEDAKIIREVAKEANKILITSYHCFQYTPNIEKLREILIAGKKLGGDIIKIATMIQNVSDLETILLFTLQHKEENIITIGMGDKGIPSRIINPLFGSLITYASLHKASAPGQIPLKEMVKIFQTLKVLSSV